MKKYLLLFFFIAPSAFALEAVVTVLEAPMFKHPAYDASVVQYLRKGDVIKVHPSIGNDPAMDQYAPAPEKLAELKKQLKKTSEYNEDPLFQGESKNTYYVEDEFIPTIDRQGQTVYVLSEHVYVYFEDSREFGQKITAHDPTDYRLEEPLPRNYPLKNPSGYRGQFIAGITQPSFESYPYSDPITRKGYASPVEVNFTLMKEAPGDYNNRLFIGGTFGYRTYSNSFSFPDRKFSEEEVLKLGIGPTISYDAFKGEKNRVNLSGTIMIYLYDRYHITQSLDERKDGRVYAGYSVAPQLNFQYHRKQILEDLDFVLGTALVVGLPTTYTAQDGGSQTGWWQSLADDEFTTRTTYTMGAYIGIQSAY
ncbi:MAG: hypothetical protein ACLGHN_07500 [Bacteriovoracia bacterium]